MLLRSLRSLIAAGCVGGGVLVAGCQGATPAAVDQTRSAIQTDDRAGDDAVAPPNVADDSALVRIVHASATSGALDFYADDATTPLVSALAYGSASAYLTLPAGAVRLVARTAGAAPSAAPVYTSAPLALAGGSRVTAVAAGLLGSTLPAIQFRIAPLVEAFAARCPDQARVRFVNASYGLPSAAFDVGDDGSAESATLAPFADSGPDGVAVARAAGRQLALRSAAARLTGFTLPARTLGRGGELFVIATGLPTFVPREPRGLALLVVDSRGATLVKQNPALYLVHAIPDAGAIDLLAFVDPTVSRQAPRAVASLAYGKLAAPLQVPPSAASAAGFGVELVVTEAGDGSSTGIGHIITASYEGTLVAGERYLVVASGFTAYSYADGPRPRVDLSFYRDGFTTALTGRGLVRVIDASGDAPALDVGRTPPGLDTFTPLDPSSNGITWQKASLEAGIGVPAVPLNPAVLATGATATAPFRFKYTAVPSTDRVFGIVAGSWAPATDDHGLGFIVVKATTAGNWTATLLAPGT